jgi:hypothetical protein
VDAGALCGAPALGAIIDHFGFGVMFLTAFAAISAVAVLFAAASLVGARRDTELQPSPVATEEQLGEW